jgi:hypothetical protein
MILDECACGKMKQARYVRCRWCRSKFNLSETPSHVAHRNKSNHVSGGDKLRAGDSAPE